MTTSLWAGRLTLDRRRSSADLSLWWVIGVWVCIVLMAPAGVKSADLIWRTYTYFNTVFFTAVMLVTVKYRKGI